MHVTVSFQLHFMALDSIRLLREIDEPRRNQVHDEDQNSGIVEGGDLCGLIDFLA